MERVEGSSHKTYTRAFFRSFEDVSRQSAQVIVSRLLALTQPRSVVDVGCAEGLWLTVFQEHGVDDIIGIDGAYVAPDLRKIQPAQFLEHDLKQPVRLDRTFDLAVSVEVAEHLPESRAAGFVEDLTRLAPLVLFSAAIPFQGGNDHVNEQWQDYWAAHFAARDFVPIDCVRPQVWTDPQVKWYYAQNTLLYGSRSAVENTPALAEAYAASREWPLSVVHPQKYLSVADATNVPLRRVLATMPTLFKHGLLRTFRRGSSPQR
jgi:SAM-dependent methyltransferase